MGTDNQLSLYRWGQKQKKYPVTKEPSGLFRTDGIYWLLIYVIYLNEIS